MPTILGSGQSRRAANRDRRVLKSVDSSVGPEHRTVEPRLHQMSMLGLCRDAKPIERCFGWGVVGRPRQKMPTANRQRYPSSGGSLRHGEPSCTVLANDGSCQFCPSIDSQDRLSTNRPTPSKEWTKTPDVTVRRTRSGGGCVRIVTLLPPVPS